MADIIDPQTDTNLQTPAGAEPPRPRHRLRRALIVAAIIIIVQFVVIAWLAVERARAPDGEVPNGASSQDSGQASDAAPKLKTEEVATNRDHVWDVAFLPTKELVFTERNGNVRLIKDGKTISLASISDVAVRGEGGLTGLAVDPDFADNRYLYTCLNSTSGDVRVARWRLKDDMTGLTDRKDIVTGVPSNPSGRHSGCQLEFGPDGYLWAGTGDTAQNLTPQPPQDPKSLGGKILRIDRDGQPAPGNQGGDFDPRVYSYGHRNTQGLAFFAKAKNGVVGVSAEHGSDVDDEINPLRTGNFGWAPPDGPYDETNLPMTDKKRFPDAVEAIWKSGEPTQAPSGVAVLRGKQWKGWDGALAVSMLKDEHLKILKLDSNLKVTEEEKVLEGDFGRLRAAVLGPDGALYLTTDNGGGQDKIIRVTPQ